MRTHRSRLKDQRGIILPLLAGTLAVLMVMTGLAIDLGAAYVVSANLTKASDAAALTAARHTGLGEAGMVSLAEDVGESNLRSPGPGVISVTYNTQITHPEVDTTRVRVSATAQARTFFLRVANRQSLQVERVVEATRFPLDMSLSLDLSRSLERNGGFAPMQAAAKRFLDYFDEDTDAIGLVTWSTVAQQTTPLQKDFKAGAQAAIDTLQPISDTNLSEGLKFAKAQLDSSVRTNSVKIVVVFTDGRPSAFAGSFKLKAGPVTVPMCHQAGANPPSWVTVTQDPYAADPADWLGDCPPDPDGQETDNACPNATDVPPWYQGVVAAYINGGFRGIFRYSDGRKIIGFHPQDCIPNHGDNRAAAASPQPLELPDLTAVSGPNIRAMAARMATTWANTIRAEGYTIFVVALGDPAPSIPEDTPDVDYLRTIANEGGVVDRDAPRGEVLFAPSHADLDEAFSRLADRVLTRITR
jgi:hypothetical protein